jgi:hypothetical protein
MEINFKAAAFADDVSVICERDDNSIQLVFKEYERLTKRSGLELNADKTEILNLKNSEQYVANFKYIGKRYNVPTITRIKICGIYYSNNEKEEYKLNVLDKIDKLKYKIKLWKSRYLTMEGKALIIKTYGLSQIIYNMQSYGFKKSEIVSTEREIFKFLWSTKDNENGRDRIKRSIMKNDYVEGGLKITDIDSLNRALKLRQFIRAFKSNHEIRKIQAWSSSKTGYGFHIYQEYRKQEETEAICEIAKETINIITEYNRGYYRNMGEEEYESDINLIQEVFAINLITYLERKNELLLLSYVKQITKLGINTLGELVQSYEHELDKNCNTIMKNILMTFPKQLISIAKSYHNDEINVDGNNLKYILISPGKRIDVNMITAKEFQLTLKKVLGRLENTDFKKKLNITSFDAENISKFRLTCKNPKLRNIYFRLIHNDFYTREKMKKFKMTQIESDKCQRCGVKETTRHLLWDCVHARNIWSLFNIFIKRIANASESTNNYEDIFLVSNNSCLVLIKIRVIQELIQINRPKNWSMDKITTLVKEIINIELFNSLAARKMDKFNNKWGRIKSMMDNEQSNEV